MISTKNTQACFERDFLIPGIDGRNVVCDLYNPGHGNQQRGVIVFLHGGGFIGGSKDQFFAAASWLSLMTNYISITVDYRTADTAPYPAPVLDTLSVFQWIYDNREKYCIDPESVFVLGGSPGANIGGMAMMADKAWLNRYGIDQRNLFQPNNGIFLNGIYDLSDFYHRNESEQKNVHMYIGKDHIDELQFIETSYRNWNMESKNLLLLHGDKDEIIPKSVCYDIERKAMLDGGSIQIVLFHDKEHAWFNKVENIYQVLKIIKDFIESTRNEV